MKVKLWYFIKNCGDGSCVPKFFKSKKAAENYAEFFDERFCEDVDSVTLEFDDDGNLVTPEPQIDEWTRKYAEERWAQELQHKLDKIAYYKETYPDKPDWWGPQCPSNCDHSFSNSDCKLKDW